MNRPFSVTLLAILAGLAGISGVLDVLRLLHILPMAQLGELNFYGFSLFGAIFAAIVAAIWFWAMIRIWNLDPQGWMFVVVIAIVYLIFDVVALIAGTPWQSVSLSVILSALALLLGLLPSTKAA
ncbi:MAG: hypothetical protein ACK2UO_06020, partial [Caldilineaceae bacterium]